MDKIQKTFSISDLVHLTGLSAHSIRKWESRYHLLQPDRTDTNIRMYDSDALRKLMNISHLLEKGYKISRLAGMNESELIREIEKNNRQENDVANDTAKLKLAMVTFDKQLFNSAFRTIVRSTGFENAFHAVVIPLLEETGSLWQNGIISPAQEHFLSNLIRQKLFTEIEKLPLSGKNQKETYVLFLPHNEFHEIGLLFLHYLLLKKKKNSIYLGQSVDGECLAGVKSNITSSVIFLTSLTVIPEEKKQSAFISEYRSVPARGDQLWIVGRRAAGLKKKMKSNAIRVFDLPADLLEIINAGK